MSNTDQETRSPIENLFETVKDCGKTTYELLKLKVIDRISDILSSFLSRGIVIMVLFLFLFTLNIAIALWLGELLGKTYYGFFAMSLFYGIVWGVFNFFLYDRIKQKINDSIIKQFFK